MPTVGHDHHGHLGLIRRVAGLQKDCFKVKASCGERRLSAGPPGLPGQGRAAAAALGLTSRTGLATATRTQEPHSARAAFWGRRGHRPRIGLSLCLGFPTTGDLAWGFQADTQSRCPDAWTPSSPGLSRGEEPSRREPPLKPGAGKGRTLCRELGRAAPRAHQTARSPAPGAAAAPGRPRRCREWARPPPGTPTPLTAPSPREAGTQLSAKGKGGVTGPGGLCPGGGGQLSQR